MGGTAGSALANRRYADNARGSRSYVMRLGLRFLRDLHAPSFKYAVLSVGLGSKSSTRLDGAL